MKSILFDFLVDFYKVISKGLSAPGGLCLIELECDNEFSESQKYLVDIIRINKRFSH